MNTTSDITRQQRSLSPSFLRGMAAIAIFGALALVAGNVVGSAMVPDHDWVSDTVSDLAAGKYEIIQDVALYGFAGTLAALAMGSAHLHGGSWRWSVLSIALMLLAVCVIIIGARNEYGDGDSEGIVVHIYIVYAMGVLFVGAFVLAALTFSEISKWFSRLSWGAAVFWAVGAPVFFMMSTAYDGAWERLLGLVTIVWSVALARVLWRVADGNTS